MSGLICSASIPSVFDARPSTVRHYGFRHALTGAKWTSSSSSGPGHDFRVKGSSEKGQAAAAAVGLGAAAKPAFPSSGVTYSANITTDLPIYEPPWASFDDYLEDRPRIFRAMFPDKRRSQKINDEEWKIRMLPIQFLLVSVNPIVFMRLRCRSQGKQYPSGIPSHVTKVLELQATRWELQGLDSIHMPSHFELSVQGLLYPERKGSRSRLKGSLEMSISLILPAVLSLIPEEVLRGVAESVLKRLVVQMKHEVDASLLADFRKFSKERQQSRQHVGAAIWSHTDNPPSTGAD